MNRSQRWPQWVCIAGAVLVLLLAGTARLLAADAGAPLTVGSKPVLVAKVGGEEIFDQEVDLSLLEVVQARPVPKEMLPRLRAEMLANLIDRRLIVSYLDEHKLAASKEEMDLFVNQITKNLSEKKSTFKDYLASLKVSEAEFRSKMSFQVGWDKYLKENISEDTLYEYYKAHKREYDGTEVRASHILFRPAGPIEPEVMERAKKQAAEIRTQIEKGEISFSDAAKKYSVGPSRFEGGDLNFFPRHGVMLEPFAAAAFALEKGQISPPVQTTFGIHLIYVTDIKPGKLNWDNVKNELRVPFAQELFDKIAAEQAKTIKVEYTGAMPHYKPGTKELAE